MTFYMFRDLSENDFLCECDIRNVYNIINQLRSKHLVTISGTCGFGPDTRIIAELENDFFSTCPGKIYFCYFIQKTIVI